jgi:trans-aconitate 2-methyltransferase
MRATLRVILVVVPTDAWDHAQYARFERERSVPFFDLLDLVEPCPGGRVVDLGCGTGELTRALHERTRARSTVGIDSSQAMLERGAAHRATSRRPGVVTGLVSSSFP